MAQLPQAAQGAAIAILIYSFICLLCNILMLWLLRTSRQTFSHIGLISIATLFCVCANIAQQINDNLHWVDVMTARFFHVKKNAGNPMLVASNGYTGLDLYLWSIRYGSETIAAALGCFWALSLTQAVYDCCNQANWVLVNRYGKVLSIILPIIFMILCHLDVVQSSEVLFYILLDILFFGSIAVGAALLLAILVKYIQTRRELKTWEIATCVDGRTTWRSFRLEDDVPVGAMPPIHSTGIYDNWLLTRFSVAFVFMCIFELDSITIQVTGQKGITKEVALLHPDLSASHAISTFALFIPSAFASLLALFTFGTTKHFRNTMYRTFVPRRWQRRPSDRESPPLAPPAPAASAQEHWNTSTGDLERRFADPRSWAAGIRHVSGGIALQDLRTPREPCSARHRGSSRNTAGLRDSSIPRQVVARKKENSSAVVQEARSPTPVLNETTYPI